ncbi:unnamed protein product [Phytophthora fragariaefolia]|uniref:Unnamed protein product n=1 Tax=Phytophthora fragariaefolia TaxID=1490495 RepID=A0A9W7D5P5_9STRA|nr:unnamed protein product [Phytophthora fragariaefolia]
MIWRALKNRIALSPADSLDDLGVKIGKALAAITKREWVGEYKKVQLQETAYINEAQDAAPAQHALGWFVMPQGLKNAPATFNRMVSHVLRPLRAFAPSYFDDTFVHSHAEDGLSAIDVHQRHLRQVCVEKMRENKHYANLKICVLCVPEIPVLGCYVRMDGVRADPEKISSICSWPTPKNQTELRQWLGLTNYLHKYTKEYAGLIQPMSSLLKKDVA